MQREDGRPSVVVIGGGYAGYAAAKGLDEFADVTLVEPRDAFVHNVAALRALVDPEWLPAIFLSYDKLLVNGRVMRARAVEAAPNRVVLSTGEELTPDFILLASGSTYPYPAKADADDTAVAISHYQASHAQLEQAQRVLIAGAGPTGLELAGEINARWPEKQITILEPASDILAGPYKQALRDEVRRQLEARSVEFILGEGFVAEPETPPVILGAFAATTTTGRTIEADIWFRCNGLAPVSDYLGAELAAARSEDGWVRVSRTLQVEGQTSVFAIGDVSSIDFKTAARAGGQAQLAVTNIRALIDGDELQDSVPNPPAIVIPLGPHGGASELPGQDEIAGSETTSNIKGEHLFLGRYRELFGLQEP